MNQRVTNIPANDIPYSSTEGNPLAALQDALAFSSNDWGSARDFAWIYGIVCGWDGDVPEESAMSDMAAKFGWSKDQVTRLRALHAEFLRLKS